MDIWEPIQVFVQIYDKLSSKSYIFSLSEILIVIQLISKWCLQHIILEVRNLAILVRSLEVVEVDWRKYRDKCIYFRVTCLFFKKLNSLAEDTWLSKGLKKLSESQLWVQYFRSGHTQESVQVTSVVRVLKAGWIVHLVKNLLMGWKNLWLHILLLIANYETLVRVISERVIFDMNIFLSILLLLAIYEGISYRNDTHLSFRLSFEWNLWILLRLLGGQAIVLSDLGFLQWVKLTEQVHGLPTGP